MRTTTGEFKAMLRLMLEQLKDTPDEQPLALAIDGDSMYGAESLSITASSEAFTDRDGAQEETMIELTWTPLDDGT